MNLTQIIDIKERIATGEHLTMEQRSFVIDCIVKAVAILAHRAPSDHNGSGADGVRLQQQLVREIAPRLHGAGPAVQSAVLAELLAMWVAGHSPRGRAFVLAQHTDLVLRLLPISEAKIFGAAGHPDK